MQHDFASVYYEHKLDKLCLERMLHSRITRNMAKSDELLLTQAIKHAAIKSTLPTCEGGVGGIRVCGSAVWAGGEGADLGAGFEALILVIYSGE
jgi:hypothetical protein